MIFDIQSKIHVKYIAINLRGSELNCVIDNAPEWHEYQIRSGPKGTMCDTHFACMLLQVTK